MWALLRDNELSLTDSLASINIDGKEVDFENAVLKSLEELNKMRPTIRPVSKVVSVDEFFSETPMNHFAQKWLLQDLQAVFGL